MLQENHIGKVYDYKQWESKLFCNGYEMNK